MLIPFSEILDRYTLLPQGVLHIGAWDGVEMEDYAKRGITNVVFIEAQKSIMPTLRNRIQPYPGAKALNYCVSDESDITFFNVTSNGQSSSLLGLGLHKFYYPDIKVVEQIPVVTTTVWNVFQQEKLNYNYDFVNIDTQGTELKIIKGMGSLITHVRCFYLEVNEFELYNGCCLVEEIDAYLEKFGFGRVETKWTGDHWGDAIYLKQ